MLIRLKSAVLSPALLCPFLLAVCIAASYPVVQMSSNDDWSYTFSARVLAHTGHIVYNGWATAMLGWQLYWGALFIRLFGFSFFVVRMAGLTIAMLSLALLQRILVRVGINAWNSTLATLAIAFSPIFFTLSFSFMSDVPGLFCLLVCLYLCVRALQARTDHAVLGWLAAASLSNVVLGTVRQTSWLGALVLVPCAAWCVRRRRAVLPFAAALWCVSALLIVLCMRWFARQPYMDKESLFTPFHVGAVLQTVSDSIRGFFSVCLFLLPVLLGFALRFPVKVPRARVMGGIASVLLVGSTLLLVLRHRPVFWLAPFTANALTEKGFNDVPAALGESATVFSTPVRASITFLVVAVILALALCLWNIRQLPARSLPAETDAAWMPIAWSTLGVFLGPFTLAYLFLLVTRTYFWDRYLLPLLPIALIAIVRFYQEKIAERLPGTTVAALVVFALFDVAAFHDSFALSRARVEAATQLERLGVPRNQIHAGFEYDAWTQLEQVGFVNDKRLRNPPNAYQKWVRPAHLPRECTLFFSDHTPVIEARYAIAYEPTPCLTPTSQAPPVVYRNWLSPHRRAIYTGLLP